jgi:hypothetical protein
MVVLFVLQYRGTTARALALAVNVLLGLNLSFAAYEFSRIYTRVPAPPGREFLVNGEFGFRYYMLAKNGRVLAENSVPFPGEWIVSSELSLSGNYDSLAEEAAVPLRSLELYVRTPLRLADLRAHSGFSSVSFGVLPFSFSRGPLDRITYARTSPFLNSPVAWKPTQFSGHLVFLPTPGAQIHLPLEGEGKLHVALCGRGKGEANFRIQRVTGESILEQRRQINGELWEVHDVPIGGITEAVFEVSSSSGVEAVGWGDLVVNSEKPSPEGGGLQPYRSYLDMGDIRARPQLLDGWYGIENGAWRWMAKQAQALLRMPDRPSKFQAQLFFPANFMERAGGPVTLSIMVDGHQLFSTRYAQPGGYQAGFAVPQNLQDGSIRKITIQLDRAMSPSGTEQRELGAVVQGFGFVPVK